MIDYLQGNEFNFIVCLTKADKLSRTQQARQAAAIKKQLNVPAENVILGKLPDWHRHRRTQAPHRRSLPLVRVKPSKAPFISPQ